MDLSQAKRVAVYMGTFDPPNRAHVNVARGVLKEIGVDYVLVLPLPHSLHKMSASPFLDRLRMTQLAFAPDERLLVPADSRSARQSIYDGCRFTRS